METLVGVVAGTFVGYGAARVHARVDGGWWLNLLTAALGGYIGLHLWTESFTARLTDSALAGAAVAGAVGGAALAVLAGVVRHVVEWALARQRRQSAMHADGGARSVTDDAPGAARTADADPAPADDADPAPADDGASDEHPA